MLSENILSKNNLINLIIILIPVSYFAGNLILNLNVLVLILCVFLLFGFNVFKEKFTHIDKVVIFLFAYILINGTINNYFNFDHSNAYEKNLILIKSVLYIRFLLLYFVIKFLVNEEIINFKLIFLAFGLCSLFVSIDIIIQYIFGKDIFGFEVTWESGRGRRLSGPFGDEFIAGGYIQRYFIFLFTAILLIFKSKRNFILSCLILPFFLITLLGIFLSGNRVPLILFVLSIAMIFFYQKFLRGTLTIACLIFIGIFLYFTQTNMNFSNHYDSFSNKSKQILSYLKIRITTGEVKTLPNVYVKEIESGILTWEQNKFFGGGIKSFHYHCSKIKNSPMDLYGGTNCNTHPHNYYLEILSSLGLFGFFAVIYLFLMVIIKTLKKIHFSNTVKDSKNLLLPFFIIFVIEIFPLKTTGSFFTTTNATFLFIILSFVVGLIELKKIKYDKK